MSIVNWVAQKRIEHLELKKFFIINEQLVITNNMRRTAAGSVFKSSQEGAEYGSLRVRCHAIDRKIKFWRGRLL